jgi:hypothetical protein
MTITVALDVDGVICPVLDPRDSLRHERETGWSFTALPAVMFGSVVAKPIVQTLFDLGVASAGSEGGSEGAVARSSSAGIEVLWHTSWWVDAPESLAPALGLTHLSGSEEKLFATKDEFLGKAPTSSSTWWKLAAVQRWLDEHPISASDHHDLLIWIDDDINDAVRSGEISTQLQRDPRLAMISPSIHIGINPAELALLRQLTNLS